MKVKWYTFKENNSILSFAADFSWGSTLKGKNLLPKVQILSFKIKPHLEKGFVVQGSKHHFTKGVLLVEKAGSMKVYPYMFSR